MRGGGGFAVGVGEGQEGVFKPGPLDRKVNEGDALFHSSLVESSRKAFCGGDGDSAVEDRGALAQLFSKGAEGDQIARVFRPGRHSDVLGVQQIADFTLEYQPA